jgi:hypothetical protein
MKTRMRRLFNMQVLLLLLSQGIQPRYLAAHPQVSAYQNNVPEERLVGDWHFHQSAGAHVRGRNDEPAVPHPGLDYDRCGVRGELLPDRSRAPILARSMGARDVGRAAPLLPRTTLASD